jgi:ABC-2 type transport system ATP-binding protein
MNTTGEQTVLHPALRVNDLHFSYGATRALSGATITVPKGQFVVLLGANGAGKSTLFSIVTGLYSADSGSVSIMGHDLRRHTLDALANIGVVFQRPTLDMDLSVAQNLRYYAALQGIPRREARQRIDAALVTHGLAEYANRKAASLSGGQKRRVELARALLHEPKLLLLDEPTVGLDLQSRTDFVAHVRQLCRDYNVGVLWATHLVDEVEDSDLVIIVHKGKVIADGEVSALRQRYTADSTTALFRAAIDDADAAKS